MTASLSFGTTARDRLDHATDPGAAGAWAALESFYHALNRADLAVLGAVWANEESVRIDNPVGGTLRGHAAVTDLYRRIFAGPLRLRITFGDIDAYLGADRAVFAGRESGAYHRPDGTDVPLAIRTSRFFRYADGRWSLYHHHGSIDDPAALAAYQAAVRGE